METTQIIDGIKINPNVPKWMDSKPLKERTVAHLAEWSYRPYIIYEVQRNAIPYEKYASAMGRIPHPPMSIKEYEQTQAIIERGWNNLYPCGRYTVRVLDWGCHDKPSDIGFFNNLEDAIEYAKNYKN